MEVGKYEMNFENSNKIELTVFAYWVTGYTRAQLIEDTAIAEFITCWCC